MKPIDFPLLFKTSVGFDRLARLIHDMVVQEHQTFPPHNIERFNQTLYRITLAVPGFELSDLCITLDNSVLIIEGILPMAYQTGVDRVFLHHGLTLSSFRKIFPLADDMVVQDAYLGDGFLEVILYKKTSDLSQDEPIVIKV